MDACSIIGPLGYWLGRRRPNRLTRAQISSAAVPSPPQFRWGLGRAENCATQHVMFKRADTLTPAEHGHDAFVILRRELDEHTVVIAVEGDLDLSTAPRLKSLLIDSLDEGRSRVVVDLSLATFMDSTALSVLVGVNRRLAAGTQLAIVCARPNVLQIFEFSGTDGAFAIHPTLEDALAGFDGRTAQTG